MSSVSVPVLIGNAFAVLCGAHGDVSARATQMDCSRQTLYHHAHRVAFLLDQHHLPGPSRDKLLADNQRLRHELTQARRETSDLRKQLQDAVVLSPEKQHRFAATASALGLSSSQIEELFAVLNTPDGLPAQDTPRSPDRATIARWVLQHARAASEVLRLLDGYTRPLARVLALDEIFFHGKPVLVAVEPKSFAVLLCRRAADRKGATWLEALRPFTGLEFATSDQGSGLQAGLAALQGERRTQGKGGLGLGLDLFHLEQEAHKPLGWVWRWAEAAWEKAEAADRKVKQAEQKGKDRRGPLARARAAWRDAERRLGYAWERQQAWQQARQALGLFRPDGRLNDRAWAEGQIRRACRGLGGVRWRKAVALLRDGRMLSFLDRLHGQLAEAVAQEELRWALVELWRLGHTAEQTAGRVAEAAVQQVVCARLDEGWLGKYERVKEVLGSVVRASSAVECVNSVLRMQQARHRNLSQEMLDLKRLYWNTRPFRSGPRKGRCPYQLLDAHLSTFDFWLLLKSDPEILAQELSAPQLAA